MTTGPAPQRPLTLAELLGRRFKANEWVLEHAIAGFAEADWMHRAGEASSAAWIVGHLAWSRRNAARAAGVQMPRAEWEDAYGMGSAGEPAGSMTPSDLAADFATTGRLLRDRLKQLSDADLATEGPFTTPAGENDLASVLAFLQFHEAYHCGQLGMIRRMLGKPRIV